MEKYRIFLGSLIFNIAETILIFLIGRLLDLPIKEVIIIMLSFMISRGCFGNALHFKDWYRCLIWSALILLSLFVILKVDFTISVLFTIFSAFIMTGKSNINDMYLWNNNKQGKYKDIEDFVKYNEFNPKLLDFEENLKRKDGLLFLIYKYKFRDGLKFKEISEILKLDNPRIVESLDRIALAFRINLGI